ncbi:hypothetical protein C2845_PM17G06120 [Panicum miliaceum]|uniref:Aminotransferase-like plant mobile domain-containing protein n=1 Tax=Panicum miliaceum TaxID=4540 RepID=A0A3L6Q4C4_PANMI|nr:hypothetical protein C2845_PM17G06120 [Panicum miliaceum]
MCVTVVGAAVIDGRHVRDSVAGGRARQHFAARSSEIDVVSAIGSAFSLGVRVCSCTLLGRGDDLLANHIELGEFFVCRCSTRGMGCAEQKQQKLLDRMPRGQKQQRRRLPSTIMAQRNRASPSRLVKLYGSLSNDKRKMISDCKFDSLLQIACTTMPADLATWLFVDCFDAERSELVFPGRGRISVTADSVADLLSLPNKGAKVKYELDVDAIYFVHNKYDIVHGAAPKIDEILERIKQNKLANEDFLRSWLMIAVSTFLCPPTSLGISPRCYPALVDLERVKKLNWCNFVVDQLKEAAMNLDKKHSVRGCHLLLVLKSSGHSVAQGSFFHIDDLNTFVASKVPREMAIEKKRKIAAAVSRVLSGVTEMLGTFKQEVAAVEEPAGPTLRRSKLARTVEPQGVDVDEEETDKDSDYANNEEEWISSSEDGGSDQGADGGSDDEDGREEEESDNFVPLSKRAKRMESDPSKADKTDQ